MTINLRIIRPSSREKHDLLTPRLEQLRQFGFRPLYNDIASEVKWPFTASSAQSRAAAFMDAVLEEDSDFLLAARGGYGASDLLPLVDWNRLRHARPKLLIGFSDVSALHSAMYACLGWPGLHAPMPATTLWNKGGELSDITALSEILLGKRTAVTVPMAQSFQTANGDDIDGWLFGGCFSVLTHLIGTPYFPKTLTGAILFLEDVNEHPARLMRMWNQWLQSGVTKGVRAIVLGHFKDCCTQPEDATRLIFEQFASRSDLPIFTSGSFGHISPNMPLMIGATAIVNRRELTWTAPASLRSKEPNHAAQT